MKEIWLFFQNQILGMKWLNEVIALLLTSVGILIPILEPAFSFLSMMLLKLQYCYVY